MFLLTIFGITSSVFCLFLSIFEIYITIFCLSSAKIKPLITNLDYHKKNKRILMMNYLQKKILYQNGNENEQENLKLVLVCQYGH